MSKSAPEPELESPIRLGPESNGEVPPPPRTRIHDVAEELYRRVVEEKSRRLGISRRAFIESSCGTLAALWVINEVTGCDGGGGAGTPDSGYGVPPDALENPAQADALLAGDEFIFDVQVHNTVPSPPWNDSICNADNPRVCPTQFLREIFVASDTSVACLSGYPDNVPSIETRDGLKRLMDMVHGSPRLLFHCNVQPWLSGAALDAELAAAERNARTFPIAAWKMYADGTPGSTARLDQATRFFDRARELDVKIIAAHRGLRQAGGPGYQDVYSPRDMAAAAKANPDFTFLVYHSGFEGDGAVPYNDANPVGVDRLIKAAKEFGIGPDGNLYAELGSTWRTVMTDPARATHLIGKLLLHLGPDRILWGTDSLNVGNPSAQIAAFRMFQMSQAVQEMFGYPPLTPEVKRKILGLNAARVYGVDPAATRRKVSADDIGQLKLAYKHDRRSVPMSPHRPHGPRTWREYLGFRRWNGESV
jgi:uncharacterized protein